MQAVASSPDCFYTAKGRTCEETQKMIEKPSGCAYTEGTETKLREEPGRGHDVAGLVQGYASATGAHGMLHRYYTPELALLVEERYASDFRHFQYERPVLHK
jgi:hypothetical protein